MSTIIVQKELDVYDLDKELWSGALNTWEKIREAGKEQEAINFINEVFCDSGEVPTLTQVNDLLWFDDALIYEAIGLTPEGETPKEWTISTSEFEELKRREILSTEQLEYIEGEFYGSELANVSEQDFIDNGIELDEVQIEELDSIVS